MLGNLAPSACEKAGALKWREQVRLVMALAVTSCRKGAWEALCVHFHAALLGGESAGDLAVWAEHQAARELSPPCLSWQNWCHPDGELRLIYLKIKSKNRALRRREKESESYGKSQRGFIPVLLSPQVFPTPRRAFTGKNKLILYLKASIRSRLTLSFPSSVNN